MCQLWKCLLIIIKFGKKALLLLVVSLVLVVGWLSLSLLWYPSYDEFDLDLLTSEADVLLAQCEQEASSTISASRLLPIVEIDAPYIYSLVGDGKRFECGDGVDLVLWDDYLTSTSGLYIMGEKMGKQNHLPDSIAPYASQLGGRVYKWHISD